MRNALYGRQSLDKKDSISIETQIEKGRMECSEDDEILIYEDRGFSGKNTRRPEFRRLMADVEKGLVDRVIVYKLDRFTRSVLDFANAWAVLEKHQVQFTSINEKFDTGTPLGKAMLYIAIVFAQMERETIAERVRDNYYERVKRGSWMGGPAPYGFRIGRLRSEAGQEIPTLLPEEQLKIVKEIYDIYADSSRTSLGSLAGWLTSRKVPGPQRVTWNNVTLARLIRNPVYVMADVDIYAYYKNLGVTINNDVNEFDGSHAGMVVGKRGANTRQRKEIKEATFALANWPGIIPSDIWLTCQSRLAANEQIKNTGKGKHTWLSGLIKCGACKRSFRIIADSRYPDKKKIYCAGRSDRMCTYIPEWHIPELEDYVQQELLKTLETCDNDPVEEMPSIDNDIKIKLMEIEENTINLIANLSKALASDMVIHHINKELERLESEKQKIVEELQGKSQIRVVQYKPVNFSELDLEEKKIVANNYIKTIEVTDQEIRINWRV